MENIAEIIADQVLSHNKKNAVSISVTGNKIQVGIKSSGRWLRFSESNPVSLIAMIRHSLNLA